MSTLTLWTGRDLFADVDALVRDALSPAAGRPARFMPAAEIVRDGDDAVVRVELPGLDVAEDVTVEVDRGTLVVRGERRDERTEKQGGSLREVRYGWFRRAFRLPEHVAAEAVTASYDAGVLTLRVTGAHVGTQPRRIAVSSGPAATPTAEVESGEQPAA